MPGRDQVAGCGRRHGKPARTYDASMSSITARERRKRYVPPLHSRRGSVVWDDRRPDIHSVPVDRVHLERHIHERDEGRVNCRYIRRDGMVSRPSAAMVITLCNPVRRGALAWHASDQRCHMLSPLTEGLAAVGAACVAVHGCKELQGTRGRIRVGNDLTICTHRGAGTGA